MVSSDSGDQADHDPELARFLGNVISLSAQRRALGPDAFLERLADLEAQFIELRKYRSDRTLQSRFQEFAKHRFELIDDNSEYAHATDEVMVLTLALDTATPLVVPALKHSLAVLSDVLAE